MNPDKRVPRLAMSVAEVPPLSGIHSKEGVEICKDLGITVGTGSFEFESAVAGAATLPAELLIDFQPQSTEIPGPG